MPMPCTERLGLEPECFGQLSASEEPAEPGAPRCPRPRRSPPSSRSPARVSWPVSASSSPYHVRGPPPPAPRPGRGGDHRRRAEARDPASRVDGLVTSAASIRGWSGSARLSWTAHRGSSRRMPAIVISALLDVGADAPATGSLGRHRSSRRGTSRVWTPRPWGRHARARDRRAPAPDAGAPARRRARGPRTGRRVADPARTAPERSWCSPTRPRPSASTPARRSRSSTCWPHHVERRLDADRRQPQEPAPSVGQHLRSLGADGSGFVVTLSGPAPRPCSGRSGRRAGRAEEATRHRSTAARPEWIAGGGPCAPARGQPLHRPSGRRPSCSTRRSGSAPAAPSRLVALPGGGGCSCPTARGTCPTCATTVFTDFCPFCHVRRTAPIDSRGAIA